MQLELLTTPKPGDGDFGSELSDFLSRSRASCHQWSKHVDWYELDPGEA